MLNKLVAIGRLAGCYRKMGREHASGTLSSDLNISRIRLSLSTPWCGGGEELSTPLSSDLNISRGRLSLSLPWCGGGGECPPHSALI